MKSTTFSPFRLSNRPSLRRATPPGRRYSAPPNSQTRGRFEKFNKRLPRFLQPYTTPLLNAPATHITSFLILHEITAVVPLFGLVGAFHYGGWIPSLSDGEENNVVDEGVRKFGKWLRKKGWVESDITDEKAIGSIERGNTAENLDPNVDRGVRLILEFATAYAITKALLPVRIIVSVWSTPWFARRVLGPVGRSVGRLFGNSKKKAGPPA
ncbi:hypothetical protein PRK78_001542 [Emydomyces testavorans]|uniref:Uncharacterized protein n=1 Tax=Emydomyces testavorans TaxID=2070801 RepID=A0AAF0DEP4_9EURO|nr:hypothetical protein PRK78_001542 [Emydomyces testavorans]